MVTPGRMGRTRVTVFCGGRGAATLVRALLESDDIDLSLIVNGYDDGFSTGALRRFVPGMLGPSDFRKNVRYHLRVDDSHDAALLELLDLRLPHGATRWDFTSLLSELGVQPRATGRPQQRWVTALTDDERCAFAQALTTFDAYSRDVGGGFAFGDCSVANLILAGCYLRCGAAFGPAVQRFADLFGFPGRLLSAGGGHNAFLAAIKENGEFLSSEAEIVARQSHVPIRSLFLLPAPISPSRRALLDAGSVADRVAWLREHSVDIALGREAERAVVDADLLVYSSGTQHSSLLPTYMTTGLAAAVARSAATAKVLVMNLHRDHDMAGMDATDVVDRTLRALGDVGNRDGMITHVLFDHRQRDSANALPVPGAVADVGAYAGCRWVAGDLVQGTDDGTHSGSRTRSALLRVVSDGARRTTRWSNA